MIPTGRIIGDKTVLETTSERISMLAPTKVDAKKRYLLSEPMIILAI